MRLCHLDTSPVLSSPQRQRLAEEGNVTFCRIGLSPWLRRRLFSYLSRRGISKTDSTRSCPGGPDARKACTRLHGHDRSLCSAHTHPA